MTTANRIRRMKKEGYPIREIAAQVEMSESNVRRYLAGYDGPVKSKPVNDVEKEARRLLRAAKSEEERRCIIANFGDLLGIKSSPHSTGVAGDV